MKNKEKVNFKYGKECQEQLYYLGAIDGNTSDAINAINCINERLKNRADLDEEAIRYLINSLEGILYNIKAKNDPYTNNPFNLKVEDNDVDPYGYIINNDQYKKRLCYYLIKQLRNKKPPIINKENGQNVVNYSLEKAAEKVEEILRDEYNIRLSPSSIIRYRAEYLKSLKLK